MSMKRIGQLSFVFSLCLFIGIHSPSLGNEGDDVFRAAELGLKPFLTSIPEGFEPGFGFENREEFVLAILGKPYQVCTIQPKDLAGEAGSIEGVIVPLEEFRFPILCQGTMRALLTVARMQGQWRAVEIGAAGLASEFDRLERTDPVPGKECRRILLRLYQLKMDFAGFRETSQRLEGGKFFPLRSARMALRAGEEMIIPYSFPETLKLAKDKFTELLAGAAGR